MIWSFWVVGREFGVYQIESWVDKINVHRRVLFSQTYTESALILTNSVLCTVEVDSLCWIANLIIIFCRSVIQAQLWRAVDCFVRNAKHELVCLTENACVSIECIQGLNFNEDIQNVTIEAIVVSE